MNTNKALKESALLKVAVSKDKDTKDTVTFNYNKYEVKGTPHDVWLSNVNKVEEVLETILNTQPFETEYPIMHLRREERDNQDRVIRVHFDILGKTTLLKFVRALLAPAENIYVEENLLASNHKEEFIKSLGAEVIPIPNPKKAKETVEKYLKNKGIDPASVKIVYSGFPENPEIENAKGLNPLNLDELEDQDSNVLNINPFLVSNSDSEDFN